MTTEHINIRLSVWQLFERKNNRCKIVTIPRFSHCSREVTIAVVRFAVRAGATVKLQGCIRQFIPSFAIARVRDHKRGRRRSVAFVFVGNEVLVFGDI
jgi:hypothetical protein